MSFSLLIGCDHVIDKSKENIWEASKVYVPKGFQVVFDANGVETLQESYNHLAPGGKLVVYGMCLYLVKWCLHRTSISL